MNNTILQINVNLNSGSTGRIVEDIGDLLIERGDKSYSAYGRYFSSSTSEPIKIGSSAEVYFHVLQTRFLDKHGNGSNIGTMILINQIRKINPDIIHLHSIHGYYLNIQRLFAFLREYGKPIVWTLHDNWSFTSHCTAFSYANCTKWKTGCYQCPLLKSYPKSLFVDNSKNNYEVKNKLFTGVKGLTLTTVSEFLASNVAESFLREYPIEVIYNGINTDVFSPNSNNNIREKYKIGDKYMILGVASQWGIRKALSDFCQLSKMLDNNAIIVLVGLNRMQIKQLPEKIIGVSNTESINELAKFYSAADVFVNPS